MEPTPKNPYGSEAPPGKLFTLETPQEMHRRLVWRSKTCMMCGGRPVVIAATVHVQDIDLARHDPAGLAQGRYKRSTQFDEKVTGVRFFLGQHFACSHCQKAFEQDLAHHYPPATIVLFDRGVSANAKTAIVVVPTMPGG